jgi:hypothetical protein
MNRPVSFIIRVLREDSSSPGTLKEVSLSTGILDVFFSKIVYRVSLLASELINLIFAHYSNSLNSNNPSSGRQFDSILSIKSGSFFSQFQFYRASE